MGVQITVLPPAEGVPYKCGVTTYRCQIVDLGVAILRDGKALLSLQIGDEKGEITLDAQARGHLIALLSRAS